MGSIYGGTCDGEGNPSQPHLTPRVSLEQQGMLYRLVAYYRPSVAMVRLSPCHQKSGETSLRGICQVGEPGSAGRAFSFWQPRGDKSQACRAICLLRFAAWVSGSRYLPALRPRTWTQFPSHPTTLSTRSLSVRWRCGLLLLLLSFSSSLRRSCEKGVGRSRRPPGSHLLVLKSKAA